MGKEMGNSFNEETRKMKTKQCAKCNEVKPVTEFGKYTRSKDGLKARCKECMRADAKKYNEENRAEVNEYYRAWREANREKIRKARKAYREENRAEFRERGRAWKEANRELLREANKVYYEENKVAYSEYNKAYRKVNKDKINAHRAVHRALKAGTLTKPDTCARCQKRKVIEGHHEDYSKPLEVDWLCISCHKRLHAEENDD